MNRTVIHLSVGLMLIFQTAAARQDQEPAVFVNGGAISTASILAGKSGAVIEDPVRKDSSLHLIKAVGNLVVKKSVTTDTFEVYFHVPIAYAEQVPILIQVKSAELIDFRFVPVDPPNLLVAARLENADHIDLDWTAWVLVKENRYENFPRFVPIPEPEDLPEEVRKWLEPTDCVQTWDPLVQEIAGLVRGDTENLMELAENINEFCWKIPWYLTSNFDAVSTLRRGSSCTGHAHAGAALFRANGIPARTILNMTAFGTDYSDWNLQKLFFYDHHWIIDYYVPGYGWVRMETSMGLNPAPPELEAVTYVNNPEDEFPLFRTDGIDVQWHTSDPCLGMNSPDWVRAHTAYREKSITTGIDRVESAHRLTTSVFSHYTGSFGINLDPAGALLRQDAVDSQTRAVTALLGGDLDGYLFQMEEALGSYEQIAVNPFTNILVDDFETEPLLWTHGGDNDEWEWGTPLAGPEAAHSGTYCWGTDLDDTYENHSDSWLLSPWIDLSNMACAFLEIWVWNSVREEKTWGKIEDYLWVDVTTDGTTFKPLCNRTGGISDNENIPSIGGWSRLVLDLTEQVDHRVQIRFRFHSNSSDVESGSCVDDLRVYGRAVR